MEVIFLNEDLVKQAHPVTDMVKYMAVPRTYSVVIYTNNHWETAEDYDLSIEVNSPLP